MKARTTSAIAAILLVLGLTTAFTSQAGAQTGFQYIAGYLGGVQVINAWNGGPFVKVWNMAGSTNNDFTAGADPFNNRIVIEYTGGGSWNGQCVGDAYNNSSRADTSLDPCATSGNNGGWGTNFSSGNSGCGSDQLWFHNDHWGGYLAGDGVGTPFYLNVSTKVCYSVIGAA